MKMGKIKSSSEQNRKNRIKQAKEYVNKNVWKRFLKYKIMELGIIPLSILTIWKLPLWIGWGIIKLFNINPVTNKWFCENINMNGTLEIICDNVNYDIEKIWLIGFIILFLIIIFVGLNYWIAHNNIKSEAEDKFNVNSYDDDW